MPGILANGPGLGPICRQAVFEDCLSMGHTSGKVIGTEGGHPIQLTRYCSTQPITHVDGKWARSSAKGLVSLMMQLPYL